jgi:hypothetical protein
MDYGVCAVVLPHTHLCTAVARTDGLGWGVVALVVLYTAEIMAAVDVVAVAEERASSRKKHAAREAFPQVEQKGQIKKVYHNHF